MVFNHIDFLAPPQGLRGRGQKKCAIARPIHVSNTHTKFGWSSSNGLGGDSVTDRRTNQWTEGRTDGRMDGRRRLQYPLRFFKKAWG